MQRQFQQLVDFLVPSVQFLDRVVDFPAACRSWYAQCTLYSRPWRSHRYSSWDGCRRACCCAATGALVGLCRKLWSLRSGSFWFVQFLDKVAVPVGATDREPRNVWFDYGSMLCIIQGGFWKNFMIFYVTGCLGPEVDSPSWRARRRQGSGMRFSWFCWL